MKTSHVEHRGVLSFSRRFPRVFVLGIVAFMFAVLSGVIPAYGAASASPIIPSAIATTAGKGLFSAHTELAADQPYVIRADIVNGTFAGGGTSVTMNVDGLVVTPSSAVYNCTGSNTSIQVTFVAGGVMNPMPAPCGAIPAPPVWKQSAQITVGAAGSGNATVALVNGSNASAVFAVYLGGNQLSQYTVNAGGSVSKSLTGLTPGKTLAVYGIKDGSASLGSPLDSALVPEAPPVPVWNQTATITLGDAGSGSASVTLGNKSDASAVYVVYYDGKELSRYTVPANGTVNKSLPAVTPGKTLAVYGIKDGSASLGSPLDSALVPEAPAEPTPIWNQSATIHLGADGSGNADVLFDNEKSNQTGVFYVTVGDGEPTSATSVAAGQTKSIPVHGEPGDVIRVYGTKDGKATPKPLKELMLPEAPAESHDDTSKQIGMCLWVGEGKFRGYTLDMLRVGVILQGEGDSFSRHIIPPFNYTHDGVKRHYDGQNWTDANQELFDNGCKTEVEEPPYIPNEPAEVPSTPESPEVPATPLIPRVSSTPTVPPASIAAKKTAVKDVKKAGIDRSKITFETGVSDTATSTPIQNNGPWSAVLLTVGLAIIAGVFFRRHTVKVGK